MQMMYELFLKQETKIGQMYDSTIWRHWFNHLKWILMH